MSILELSEATKRYGRLTALAGLTLTVQPGEVHAIIGLNGAGKTTAMKSVVGHLRLDDGAVRLFGVDVSRAGPAEFARLGFIVDHPFGYPELTVRSNIAFAARLHGMPADVAREVADQWIDRLELARWASNRAGGLSQGNRQRLGFACAAAHRPELLILDEPTSALDPAGVLLLRDLLLEASAAGAGVLVSSHHLDEVSRIAHRITVVHAGRAVGVLQPGEVDLERRFFDMVHAWDTEHRLAEHP